MPQQTQNQSVTSSSTTPQPNHPQPTNNKPDAFAQLAEEVATAQAYLNNPKVQKSSARREPVLLVPQPHEPPRQASEKQNDASPASSLPQAASTIPATAASRLARHQLDDASSASSLPQAASDQPADASQTPSSGHLSAARRNESVAASATALPKAAPHQPAAANRTPSGVPDPASLPPCFLASSSSREIRRPLNPHKIKEKPNSNR